MPTDHGQTIQTKGQPSHRHGITMYDEHRRPWGVTLDKRTMSPVSIPIPRFEAPFYPPSQYLRQVRGHIEQFATDYEQWLADQREAQREYEHNLQLSAMQLFPNQVAAAMENPGAFPALMRLVGMPPLSERFIRALRAGNRWATGADADADPARWFSEAELLGFDAWVAKHSPPDLDITADLEEFDGVEPWTREAPWAAHPEDAAEFEAPAGDTPPATPRPRRPRKSSTSRPPRTR